MVLGKLPVPGCPTIWMLVGQGPIALAMGAGGGCLDIIPSSIFSLLFPMINNSSNLCSICFFIQMYLSSIFENRYFNTADEYLFQINNLEKMS